MNLVIGLAQTALFFYWLVLIGRIAYSWIMAMSPQWRPKGPALILVEIIYTLTDPPLRLFRTFMPTFQVGQFRIDTAMLGVFFAVVIASSILASF